MNELSTTPPEPSLSAIVIEGGGMRGIYGAGILDTFMSADFFPFDLAIGSSAGACLLASHLAGQDGRNRRIFLEFMTLPRFIGLGRFLCGGHYMDLDWLWIVLARELALNAVAAANHSTRLLVSLTHVDTGRAFYYEPDSATMDEALKATSALPLLYRGAVTINGKDYKDGGLAAPIPAEEAYRQGARRIMVIRTRPAQAVKTLTRSVRFGAWLLRKWPELSNAFYNNPRLYQRDVDWINNPPSDCEIVQVAPEQRLKTTRTTTDSVVLQADLELGRQAGKAAIEQWSAIS